MTPEQPLHPNIPRTSCESKHYHNKQIHKYVRYRLSPMS